MTNRLKVVDDEGFYVMDGKKGSRKKFNNSLHNTKWLIIKTAHENIDGKFK